MSDPAPAVRAAVDRAPASALAVIGAGVVIGALLVVTATSFSALVFNGPLTGRLQDGIGLNLVGTVVALVVVGLLGSTRGTIGGPQDVTGAVLGVATGSVAARLGGGPEAFFTVVLVTAATTTGAGAVFLALGSLRAGDLVRFIPHPVVGGFLAGTGWLLLAGGVGLVTGTDVTWGNLDELVTGATGVKLVLVLVVAGALALLVRRGGHPLVVPGALVGVVVAFHLAVVALGSDLAAVEAGGWLLGPFPGGGLWRPWSLDAVDGADWATVVAQAPAIASVLAVGVLGVLLNASALELATGHDLDLDRELRAAGLANLIVGPLGGIPAYQQVGSTVLGVSMGGASRAVPLVAAAVCASTAAFGAAALSVLPRLALGALVASLGLGLLVEWVWDASRRLRRSEHVLVLAILLAVAVLGFLAGVALGAAIAVVLFVIESSQAEVVRAELTGRDLHSNVERSPGELDVLREHGDAVHVVQLQGFLFFGTAHRLVDRIRSRAVDPTSRPLAWLVLDFSRVSGMDASAVVGFVKVTRLAPTLGFRLLVVGLAPDVARQLERGGMTTADQVDVVPDADRALQRCEESILAAHPPTADTGVGHADRLAALLDGPLGAHAQEVHLADGDVLLRAGEPSDALYVVRTGSLSSLLERADGASARLRSMGAGSIIGEVGLYGGMPRTATVVSDGPSSVVRVTAATIEELGRDDPQLVAQLHDAVAGLLAVRLARTTLNHNTSSG